MTSNSVQAYITRLCWNTNNWISPSGSASQIENGTFATQFGFGFEERLFSPYFIIGDWQYGFIQGINKSQKRLAGQTIDLYLYTIDKNKNRYLIGEIKNGVVLTLDESVMAHKELEKKGTILKMIDDVEAVGGQGDFIKSKKYLQKWTLDIINFRYKISDFIGYQKDNILPKSSIIWKYSRYQLVNVNEHRLSDWLSHVYKDS